MEIKKWQEIVHHNAVNKDWWDAVSENNNIPEKIALIHSEASEALEDYRNQAMELTLGPGGKPVGFPVELADIVIRVLDLAEYLGHDLERVIALKHKYNESRAIRHGNKAC
jgi:hypothetical protein